MNTLRSAPRTSRPLSRPGLCLALSLILALASTAVLAQAPPTVAAANSQSAAKAETPWLSGGIGDEALLEMRKVAPTYNVHIVFSSRSGSYLAGVPFRVLDGAGRTVYSGISDGPILYLKLAPGAYRVAAEIDALWQERRIRASRTGAPVKLMFVAKGE